VSGTDQHRQNKALHPTAYAPVVPPFAPAAGELGRCVAARGLDEDAAAFWAVVAGSYWHFLLVGGSARFFFEFVVMSLSWAKR